jgi:thioesterase domain-containing protein
MPRYQTLMPIRTKGAAPPLFCVHGQPLKIAQRINPDRPIYGLSHVYYSDFLDEAPESIEYLAAQYLSEIRQVQPNGPYHFCGFSAGGMIAFEIARQLLAEGDKVGELLLVEPTVMNGPISLANKVGNAMLESDSLLSGLRQLLVRAPNKIMARIRIYLRMLAAQGYFMLRQPLPERLRWIGYLKALGPAMRKYEYQPIDCHGTLLYKMMDDEHRSSAALYWGGLFLKGVAVEVLPDVGRHKDFMVEPALSQTVALIDRLALVGAPGKLS